MGYFETVYRSEDLSHKALLLLFSSDGKLKKDQVKICLHFLDLFFRLEINPRKCTKIVGRKGAAVICLHFLCL